MHMIIIDGFIIILSRLHAFAIKNMIISITQRINDYILITEEPLSKCFFFQIADFTIFFT